MYFRDLDFINLMSYDFYGSWEVIIGYYSVFYGCFGEVGMVVLMNVVWFFKSDGGFLFYMGYKFFILLKFLFKSVFFFLNFEGL